MSDVAADRARVRGAGAIEVPPSSAYCNEHDAREGGGKRAPAEPSNCAGTYHVKAALYLQKIAVARDKFVKNRVNEKADQHARDQSGDDHDGEWLLCIRANSC